MKPHEEFRESCGECGKGPAIWRPDTDAYLCEPCYVLTLRAEELGGDYLEAGVPDGD